MGLQDWVTLCLASLVVAFAVFAEIRDAVLCENRLASDIKAAEVTPRLAIRHTRPELLPGTTSFFPNVVLSVVQLVLNDGGNVKNVCLNTVAVLFLLEVDKEHGVPARSRRAHAHGGRRNTGARVQKTICKPSTPPKSCASLRSLAWCSCGLFGPRAPCVEELARTCFANSSGLPPCLSWSFCSGSG